MKTVKTPKGTELPLVNLKGKAYLLVGHRIQWINEAEPNFSIETRFLHVDDEQTIAQATIKVLKFDESNGVTHVIKQATATKRETKKDFSDHTEKAETGAIGRCLSYLGYGTQFALSDLEESHRIVDAPVEDVKSKASAPPVAPPTQEDKPKASGFSRNNKPEAPKPPVQASQDDGWQ